MDDFGIYVYEVFIDGSKVVDLKKGSDSLIIKDLQPGINHTYKIIARDSSGLASKPAYLFFNFGNSDCNNGGGCLYSDSIPTAKPVNVNYLTSNDSLTFTWDSILESDFDGYELVLNGQLFSRVNSTISKIPRNQFQNGWNIITVQSTDDDNNRSVSEANYYFHFLCPNFLNLTSSIDDFIDKSDLKRAKVEIEASNKITGTSSEINYQSEKRIILSPGFHVQRGNVFKADIKNCYE